MIVLFTDFGSRGPYVGQLHAVLMREAPGVGIVDLLHDAPACDPRASAYLLAAFAPEFPTGSVFLAVVDPGVGGARGAAIVEADGRWFVGPENGLFELLVRRACRPCRCWQITWQPPRLSASFHGRDLFAPVAARLALGHPPAGRPRPIAEMRRREWPDDLAEVVYIDGFGNAMTGIRAASLSEHAILIVNGHAVCRTQTFSAVEPGSAFWYENANGLAELAVNAGRAESALGLRVGTRVSVGSDGVLR